MPEGRADAGVVASCRRCENKYETAVFLVLQAGTISVMDLGWCRQGCAIGRDLRTRLVRMRHDER